MNGKGPKNTICLCMFVISRLIYVGPVQLIYGLWCLMPLSTIFPTDIREHSIKYAEIII